MAQGAATMGIWGLWAAACFLGVKVISRYPAGYGWKTSAELNDRILWPSSVDVVHPTDQITFHILWCSTRDDMTRQHWVANHFVPLMKLHCAPESVSVVSSDEQTDGQPEPRVGDTFLVLWKGVKWVAQILSHNPEHETVLISFMWERGVAGTGVYYWPGKEDLSEEPVSCLEKKVTLALDEKLSTHRQQFFQIV